MASGEFSYSIPSGAVLNTSTSAYEGTGPGRRASISSAVAAAAAASPPTNYDAPQSVDSGFASDYPLCSPMPSPMGDHRQVNVTMLSSGKALATFYLREQV